jgi:hypothetical protein
MRLFREYPKLLLICLSMVVAYTVYALGGLHWLDSIPKTGEYVAVFIGGLLFSVGFTSPFGIGVFLEIGHMVNPFVGGILGGLGSLIADLMIFEVMRFEFFHDELHRIRSTAVVQKIHAVLHHERFPKKLREYLLWSFAGKYDHFKHRKSPSSLHMQSVYHTVFCLHARKMGRNELSPFSLLCEGSTIYPPVHNFTPIRCPKQPLRPVQKRVSLRPRFVSRASIPKRESTLLIPSHGSDAMQLLRRH